MTEDQQQQTDVLAKAKLDDWGKRHAAKGNEAEWLAIFDDGPPVVMLYVGGSLIAGGRGATIYDATCNAFSIAGVDHDDA